MCSKADAPKISAIRRSIKGGLRTSKRRPSACACFAAFTNTRSPELSQKVVLAKLTTTDPLPVTKASAMSRSKAGEVATSTSAGATTTPVEAVFFDVNSMVKGAFHRAARRAYEIGCDVSSSRP